MYLQCETEEPALTAIAKVLAELEKQDDLIVVQISAYVGDTPNDALVKCLEPTSGASQARERCS